MKVYQWFMREMMRAYIVGTRAGHPNRDQIVTFAIARVAVETGVTLRLRKPPTSARKL